MNFLSWKYAVFDVALLVLGFFFIQSHMPAFLQIIALIFLPIGSIHLLVFLIIKLIKKIALLPFKLTRYGLIIVIVVSLIVGYILLNNAGFFYGLNGPINGLFGKPLDKSCVVDTDCAMIRTSCGYSFSYAAANKNWKKICLFKSSPHEIMYLQTQEIFRDPLVDSSTKCISETCTQVRDGQNCGVYERNGEKEIRCATCGNNVCEPYEECISSSISCTDPCQGEKNCANLAAPSCIGTDDCGGLYCPSDCESSS